MNHKKELLSYTMGSFIKVPRSSRGFSRSSVFQEWAVVRGSGSWGQRVDQVKRSAV